MYAILYIYMCVCESDNIKNYMLDGILIQQFIELLVKYTYILPNQASP